MSITIFLADDHPIVRDGLQLILEAQSGLKVVGAADNGRETVHKVTQHCPDVVIMDITMPDLNGIEATQQIRQACSTTRVIILSMHGNAKYIMRALQAGADGYLIKGSASAEVVAAVYAVYAGRRYLSERISNLSIDEYLRQRRINEVKDPFSQLSAREREVLQLVVEGKSSAEIADLLSLSPNTVKTYRSRLMQKLNIDDLPALVKFAVQHGLTPPE